MELKKTTKWDGKLKGVRIVNNQVVDSDGVIVDLIDVLSKAYSDAIFDISTTTKIEEIIDLDEPDEVYIGDLAHDPDEDE